MSLPSDPNAPWPPASAAKYLGKYAEWSAWYSGDPERLIDVYAGQGASQTPDAHVASTVPWYKFWARQRRVSTVDQGRANLHVPLPGDLASVNAALLFSEEVRVQYPLAHQETPSASATETEKRLKKLIEDGGVFNRLIEAAETAAAMGGVYLYPAWDKSLAAYPILSVAQVDQSIPTFRFGMLVDVLFWRDVRVDGQDVIRHLESHEVFSGRAHILHGLYRGTRGTIGRRIPLNTFSDTAMLEDEITLPFADLDVQYIPNMRPNRLWRNSPLGISDYSGSEGLFDALDETYASWMRDIRLGKGRIIVPSEYLTNTGTFVVDHEVFSPLTMEPAAAQQGARSIEISQFDIRVSEHRDTALDLTERIVSNAGYSPQTFGLRIEGRAESGTALRMRENKTFLTQRRKGHWWRPALEKVLTQLLMIDKTEFKTPGTDPNLELDVELADIGTMDQVELAQTLNTLKQAMAASTEVRVKMAHPEWGEEQVKSEVEKIKEEEGMNAMMNPELPGLGTGGNAEGGPPEPPAETA